LKNSQGFLLDYILNEQLTDNQVLVSYTVLQNDLKESKAIY